MMMEDFEWTPVLKNLDDLLAAPSTPIGSVVSMTYDEAIIATNDFQVREAGGLPQRCFLLAVPTPLTEEEPLEEIVLLSVQSMTTLDSSREYQAVRENLALSGNLQLDARTQSSLQNVGFKCVIVGTFFRDHEGVYRFGGDVDRIRGNSIFKVYRPRGRALSLIASYSHPRPGQGNVMHDALDIGVVRYSETQMAPDSEARAFVNVEDFIGKKTAVFGLTRTGKSNTMKTIIQKVFQYSHQPGKNPIGQLIFDPQGEYANVNSQDGNSALSQIGDDDEIRIYKMLFGKRESPKERHLQFNLFDEHNLDLTWRMMTGELRSGISGEANYIQPLFDLSFARPDDGAPKDAFGAFSRKQLALYALMGRSKFHGEVKDFTVYLGEDIAERAADQVDEVELDENKGRVVVSSTYASVELFQFLMKYEQELPDFWRKDLKDGPVHEIKTQLLNLEEGRNGVIGAFNRIKPLHNTSAQGDVREKIWHDLKAGRLVIVDLSRGSSRTTTTLSEMIVGYLVNEASKNFTSGAPSIPFQIVVEEAHNLFRREGAKTDAVDPWVRLSKEAAKYSIGLVYATQEVTGVDSQILSNTVNWVVAHLNSRIETNELAKYYSFGAWADHLLKVETKGFVRMKTESSPYVVPVQIDRFVAQAKPKPKAAKKSVKKVAEPDLQPEPSTYSDAEYDELI